jgi:hypothetical protein
MNSKSLNLLTALTMGILMLMPAAARAQQSALFNSVLSLGPAGYWPLHETNLPTASDTGDIETNYGTLGLLGTGYYPDWNANSGAFARQVPGAIAGDSDTALHFTKLISSGAGAAAIYTNQLYVPHAQSTIFGRNVVLSDQHKQSDILGTIR